MSKTKAKTEPLDVPASSPLPEERKRKPLGGARKPRSGVFVQTGIRVRHKRTPDPIIEDDEDHAIPVHVPSPVSLVAMTTSRITDAMVGLKDDPKAQEDAETYIRLAIAYNRKQAVKELPNG